MYEVLLVAHTLLVLFLIGAVLIQRTDSDGLSGLGGGGGNQFLTGRGSANLLTRTTAILAGVFMLTSLILAIMAGNVNKESIVDSIPVKPPLADTLETPAAITQTPDAQTKDVPATTQVPAESGVPKPE
ncbi:MAG: preprotein translocase subunit SecG [Alphaproteobacteria bacterium]